MKKTKILDILILLVFMIISLNVISCEYVSFGDNFANILSEVFESKVTYYEENPITNPDSLKVEHTYKIGRRYDSIDITPSELSDFRKKHPGYTVKGWVYLCNAFDNSVTDLPENISTDADGCISSLTIPLDSFWVYALWEAASDTPYKVRHYKQNLTMDGYDLLEEESLTGTTLKDTKAEAKDIEGFHSLTFDQKIISADGDTVVDIYYDRNLIEVSIIYSGVEEPVSGYYGLTLTDSQYNIAEHIPSGYEFDKWKVTYENGTTETITDKYFVFTKANAKYELILKMTPAKAELKVTFPDTNDANISFSEPVKQPLALGGLWKVSIGISSILMPDGCTAVSYEWYLNGSTSDVTVNAANPKNCSFDIVGPGVFQVVVVVTDNNGNIYSAEVDFQVTDVYGE